MAGLSNPAAVAPRVVRHKTTRDQEEATFTHGTQKIIGTTSREPVVAAAPVKHRKRCNFGKFFARLLVR
jgi:hypothetical protein